MLYTRRSAVQVFPYLVLDTEEVVEEEEEEVMAGMEIEIGVGEEIIAGSKTVGVMRVATSRATTGDTTLTTRDSTTAINKGQSQSPSNTSRMEVNRTAAEKLVYH